MVAINYAFREISCKIVYYGPGLSGKTTNLQYVHGRIPAKSRGDLISLATEADRTLYFDFLPIHVGDIGGFSTKFQLYTVPGQVFYNATRKLVLRGVDGIVFVADSQRAKMDENIESLANMLDNLRENEINADQLPLLIQYNKRDLPDIVPVADLEQTLNPDGRPSTEAVAVDGVGVFDTLKRITKMVLEDTKRRTSGAVAPPVSSGVIPVTRPVSGGVPVADRETTTSEAPARASATVVATAERPAAAPPMPVVPSPRPVDVPAPRAMPSDHESLTPPAVTRRSAPPIIAAQRSTRVRRRHRSFIDRLFGWLFGR